jgi:hypothetical protein
MRHRSFGGPAWLLAVLLGSAGSASAGSLTISYEFSSGIVNDMGPPLWEPATGGTLVVRFPALGPYTIDFSDSTARSFPFRR